MSARTAITSLSLLLLLMACGGETPTEDFTPPPDESQSGSEDTEAASPWASLDTAALVALSRDRVAARIAEIDPDFDLAQLPAQLPARSRARS